MKNFHGTKSAIWKLLQRSSDHNDECFTKFGNHFGYLFQKGDVNFFSEDDLISLAKEMKEHASGLDSETPIGFAFLGQFIDHDITFDTVTELGKSAQDIDQIENLRTPRLELDSIYLFGPEGSPYLYNTREEGKLNIGTESNSIDLQRNSQGVAIIGDPRNDENLFISQLHGLFIRFHNWLLEQKEIENFEAARSFVRKTYQKIVVDEFLPAFIDKNVLDAFISGLWEGKLPGPIDWEEQPSMSVEFAAAGFRFGHSVIRQNYLVNSFEKGTLFDFPSFQPIESKYNLDWKLFFDINGEDYQKAKLIDTFLVADLFSLPFANEKDGLRMNLAARNLIRGQRTFGILPAEEIVSRYFKIDPIPLHPSIKKLGLKNTPLWFYILAEAEFEAGKEKGTSTNRMGFVGSHIVAGTLLQMLIRDKESYVNTDPEFDPFALLPNSNSLIGSIIKALESYSTA